MTAYYNECDPYCAAWLRNLISANLIAPGEVDERLIQDIRPSDLTGYTQHHFFAGLGGWSYALRLAGVPDHRPVWTGSCPCQPFSQAGKGAGFDDERHLWPYWHHLIRVCRPADILGEQVASPDGLRWLDLVQADLEGENYAVGAADLCAAGVGAPHIRQRLWFVAHAGHREGRASQSRTDSATEEAGKNNNGSLECDSQSRFVAHADERQWRGLPDGQGCELNGQASGRIEGDRQFESGGATNELEHSPSDGRQQRWSQSGERSAVGGRGESVVGHAHDARLEIGPITPDERGIIRAQGTAIGAAGALLGPWADAEWIFCTDNKWRPVGPGSFPLAHGVSKRVSKLRAIGNALCSKVAVEFIKEALA